MAYVISYLFCLNSFVNGIFPSSQIKSDFSYLALEFLSQ